MSGLRLRIGAAGVLAATVAALGAHGAGAQSLEVTVPTTPSGGSTAGSLSITPPSGVVKGTVSGTVASLQLGYTEINDTRTVNGEPTTAGWTASVSLSTPMTDGTNTIAGTRMSWATGTPEVYNGATWSADVGTVAGSGTLDQNRTAASRAASGYGRYRYAATISVDISNLPSGTYSGGITQTVS